MTQFIAFPSKINILLAGQSQSGKTVWTKRLLLHHKKTFRDPPDLIIYVYKHWQPVYDELASALGEKIRFSPDVPTENELTSTLAEFQNEHKDKKCHFLMIWDDHMEKFTRDRLFYDIVTRITHHHSLSNVFIVQDGSMSGPFRKEFLSGVHCNVFMAGARDRQSIKNLALTLNQYRCIMDSYDDCNTSRGNYLVIDTHPESDPKLKYRTNIFPDDYPNGPIIYQSTKSKSK